MAQRPIPPAEPISQVSGVVAHNLMLFGEFSWAEIPSAVMGYLKQPGARAPGVPTATVPVLPLPKVDVAFRWSGDAWVLFREGEGPAIVSGQPSYGRSQAGAVLRYRLAPHGAHRPEVYARGSSALSGLREREGAFGLSARPIAGIPFRLAAEARVTDAAGGSDVRPAAYAVTELPRVALPLRLRGEAYAQAGYVGGKFATAFVEGQARAERVLMRAGESELAAGAGVWGGAQKGAARLDVGPTAAIDFRLGAARARLAADYRFRVAGDAAPASGPAVTLSAGF